MPIWKSALTAALWFGAASESLAVCSPSAGWDLVKQIVSIDWNLVRTEEFGTTEGPGERLLYEAEWGATRKDEFGCASYYCLQTIEIKTDESHDVLYFFTWGGANFPDLIASSVALQNVLTEERCILHNEGEAPFPDHHALTELMPPVH